MPTPTVSARLRSLRKERGVSLADLAFRSGVDEALLIDIDAGRVSPTIETLHSICQSLEVPLSTLVRNLPVLPAVTELTLDSVLLSIRELDDRIVEVFRISFPDKARHIASEHGEGITEHVTMVKGAMWFGPIGAETLVRAGESLTWTGDEPHTFEAVNGPGEGILVVITPR